MLYLLFLKILLFFFFVSESLCESDSIKSFISESDPYLDFVRIFSNLPSALPPPPPPPLPHFPPLNKRTWNTSILSSGPLSQHGKALEYVALSYVEVPPASYSFLYVIWTKHNNLNWESYVADVKMRSCSMPWSLKWAIIMCKICFTKVFSFYFHLLYILHMMLSPRSELKETTKLVSVLFPYAPCPSFPFTCSIPTLPTHGMGHLFLLTAWLDEFFSLKCLQLC